ncbi:MAG TPA: cytochrome c3 family protein [Thermoanaerobaculia bacterium]|nr:cytochrome c3 family protein [Thermoanaerobaculia bacterium]
MSQIFPEWFNRAPLHLLLGGVVATVLAVGTVAWTFSPELTDVGYQPRQPVAFSHRLHAGELRIDCRYCHFAVERTAVAAIPPTSTCMKCHSLVGRDLESLAALRQSAETGEPLLWVRVHNVPDFAVFPHSPHLRAGVGCQSCHGDVAAMDELRQSAPLSMRWCLDCHRDPRPHLRPADQLTNTRWSGPPLASAPEVQPPTDCSACHR